MGQNGMSMLDANGAVLDKICVSKLPSNITEAAIRLECARHGAVTSCILQPDKEAAYITFASADMAATASRRIAGRVGVFGGNTAVEVKQVGEVPDHIKMSAAWGELPLVEQGPVIDPRDLPEYLRPREEKESKRKKSRNHSRSKKKKRKRSRSN